jgi:hypothetical protein
LIIISILVFPKNFLLLFDFLIISLLGLSCIVFGLGAIVLKKDTIIKPVHTGKRAVFLGVLRIVIGLVMIGIIPYFILIHPDHLGAF